MREAPVAIGQLLAGKYRVDKVLGAGAMGVVLAATQIALSRRVALKFLFTSGEATRESQARFLREARVAAMLQSQHAAKVLDVGALDGGEPYIVMEFLEGKDLAALLEERGPFPVEEAVTYVLQVCEAVAEAHAAGIVHRDIKPANLFLAKGMNGSPCAKLVDFGVAKLNEGPLDLTGTTQVLGSPLYMSPEALSGGKDADARTDIWALGVCLYQLLTGVTPFQRDTIQALMAAVFFKPPEPMETYRADVPAGLAAVIEQTLEKERDRRFATVAAFAAALAPYASAQPASYVERVARAQQADVVPSRPTDLLPSRPVLRAAPADARSAANAVPTLGRIGRSRTIAVVGTVLAVGISLAVFLALRPPTAPTEPAPTSAPPVTAILTAIPTTVTSPEPPAPVTQPSTVPTTAPRAPSAASRTKPAAATKAPRKTDTGSDDAWGGEVSRH